MRKYLILLLMIVAAPFAMADAVYTYTGPVYTVVSTFTACGPRPCANYTGKRITGFITTRLPVQPNSTTTLLSGDIVTFSFSDGVFTYASGDPDVRLDGFSLTTDAQGQVTGGGGIIEKWLSGAAPHSAGNIYRYMSFSAGAVDSNVANNVAAVAVSADDIPVSGHSTLAESSSGYAPAVQTGSWASTLPAPSVAAMIPGTGSTVGGTVVTLSGTNFLNGSTVTVGGVPVTLVNWVSATELQVTVPAGSPGAKDVVVTNPDAQSATLVAGFTYVAPVATPTSVPTLSEWGVILLSLLMAAVGLVVSRRREV